MSMGCWIFNGCGMFHVTGKGFTVHGLVLGSSILGILIQAISCPANQPQTPASNRIEDRIDRIELARYCGPPPPSSGGKQEGGRVGGGRWEIGGSP